MVLQGIRTNIDMKPYIFMIFQGGGVRTPCPPPPLDQRMCYPFIKTKKQYRNNINGQQKKHRLRTISKNILRTGLNRFHGASTSPLVLMWIKTYGPRREKTCLRGFANNTGTDQPAHPRSLINAFVIRVL